VIIARRLSRAGHVSHIGGTKKCIRDFSWGARRKETTWKA